MGSFLSCHHGRKPRVAVWEYHQFFGAMVDARDRYPVFMISVVPASLATCHQPHMLSSFSQFRATSVNRGDDMGWEKTVQVAAF